MQKVPGQQKRTPFYRRIDHIECQHSNWLKSRKGKELNENQT